MSADSPRKIANGAGCLAAQIIAHFKAAHGPGGVYMVAPKLLDEEYSYRVTVQENLQVNVKVHDASKRKIFDGGVAAFAAFCTKEN
jgi:uncharacterized protein (DUF2342 family)